MGTTRTRQKRLAVAYARVSSQAQKPDLLNQADTLRQFCIGSGITVDEWIQETGGGLNFKRKKFLWLIDMIVTGRVEKVIITHKDRLARFGFPLIEHLCQIQGCELIVMNDEKSSPEQELVEDILAIVQCFSSRLYGLRNYRKALKEALNDPRPQDTTESNP
jgi:predicted site-specific integrase-resolvase